MIVVIRKLLVIGVTVLFMLAVCLSGCKSGGQGAEDKNVSGEEAASKAKAMLMKGPGGGGTASDAGISKAKSMLQGGPGGG